MTKNNSTEWLDEILSDFVVWCMCGKDECIKSQNYELSKQAIRSHLLADAMRVKPSKKEVKGYNELAGYSHFAQGFNRALKDWEQAFNELLGGDKK